MRASAVPLAAALALGCTTPRVPARLPPAPYIAVMSGEMPPPIDRVSRHAWIVVQPKGGAPWRHEYKASGHGTRDPYEDFAAGDVMLHGVVTGSDEKISELHACLGRASNAFHQRYPEYIPIPGPNSNTYVASLIRDCGLRIELPATAIGRDFVGYVGAATTESGTGIILGTFPLALRLGLAEGVTVVFFGLPFGVHFFPPGIEVPVNPGRIGFAGDGHVERKPRDSFRRPMPSEPAKTGAASATLFAEGLVVDRPERAARLEGGALVGLSIRATYGGRFGWAGGFDLEAGMSISPGMMGRADLYPLGVGVLLGQTGFFSLTGGLGVSGASEHLVPAFQLPVEARLELDLGDRARIGLFARHAFAPLEPARSLGVTGMGELAFGLRTRLGRSFGFSQGAHGSGPFFGFERREVGGAALLGVFVGTELAVGFSAR